MKKNLYPPITRGDCRNERRSATPGSSATTKRNTFYFSLFLKSLFCILSFSIPMAVNSQSSDCIINDVLNDGDDLWSEQCYLGNDCEEQGNPCQANDVVMLGAFTANELGGSIITCTGTDPVTFLLWGKFHNNTGTDRYAVRTCTEVWINGIIETEVNECSFDVLPSGTSEVVLLGEFTYSCGDDIKLLNTWVGWSTTQAQCTDDSGPNYSSECGQYPPAKCSKELTFIEFLIPNFSFECGETSAQGTEICFTNLSEGGTGTLTHHWDFGDGTSSTQENPCHTYAGATGTYTVTLTSTDVNGVDASAEFTVDLEELDCCLLDIACPSPNGGVFSCVDDLPSEDPGVIVVLESCGTVTIDINDATTGSGCPGDTMYVTRTYTVSDGISTEICSQVFRFIDSTSPSITCPANVTVSCAANIPSPNISAIVTSDNCSDEVEVTLSANVTTNFICINRYTILRTYTAYDECGNTSSCTQSISVNDTAAPSITCPANVTVSCAANVPAANVAAVITSDNCGGQVSVTLSANVTTNFICTNRYTISRTYLATDACGNTSACTQLITVNDITPPSITCPANVTVSCAANIPTANVASVITSDNCGGTASVTVSADVTSNFICINRYTVSRTYLATDACGNTSTCTQLITVNDNTPPSITCPANVTVSCAANIPAANVASVITSDNCGGASSVTVSADITTNFICTNRYTVSRTYLATDACGNTSACTQLIIVNDITPPSITCPANLTVSCASNIPTANVASVITSDNCGGQSSITVLVDVTTNVICTNRYTILRTYLATDACGNTSTCTQSIFVNDTSSPTITCPANLTVSCASSISVPNVNAVITGDNCNGTVTVSAAADVTTNFVCGNQYTVLRTYIATDACGNTAACTQSIIVSDIGDPVITCPANITVSCASDVPAPNISSVITTDGCAGPVTVTVAADITTGYVCANTFIISRQYIATDACGNTSSCTQTITVDDNTSPGITCPANVTVSCVTDIPAPNFTTVQTSDNCDGEIDVTVNADVTTNFVCQNSYTILRVYTAYDACGNSSSCTQSITIDDTTPPTVTCPANITVTCTADVPAPNTAAVSSSDNCTGSVVVTVDADVTASFDCTNTYTLERTYTATDACGNTTTCVQTISVNDDVAPQITCVADLTVSCSENIPAANTAGIVATDNCTGTVAVTVNADITISQSCVNDLIVSRVYVATDVCGNSTTCAQTITVIDDVAPSITCPSDITLSCSSSIPEPNVALVSASDNCSGGVTIEHISDVTVGIPCNFVLERTYGASDACGNSTSCVQTFTFNDTQAPSITFADPLLEGIPVGGTFNVQCYGQDPTWDLPQLGPNSIIASDNCSSLPQVSFTQTLEDAGECQTDGYINLYRLSWSAIDECNNVTEAFVFMALIDTIPPEIEGVPEDVTISGSELPEPPSVFATDGCLCACIMLLEQSTLSEGCLDGQFVVRTWQAMDDCGNVTTESQRITIQDNTGPSLLLSLPEELSIVDGNVILYECERGGIPAFYDDLDETNLAYSDMSGPVQVDFIREGIHPTNCEFAGFVEEQVFTWEAVDQCGNTSSLSFTARLIDQTEPVITGVPELACIDDPVLELAEATDNCNEASLRFWDVAIPNPCGEGLAMRRTYEAYDGCGNMSRDTAILTPDDNSKPVITFAHPLLENIRQGDTITLNCQSHSGQLTTFDSASIHVSDACAQGVTVEFGEKMVVADDCVRDGRLGLAELVWTATDACGNFSTVSVMANIIDDSGPEFLNFEKEISVGCHEELSQPETADNCSEVIVTSRDSIVAGPCVYEYDLIRMFSAVDECGNESRTQQLVHVGDQGPVLEGVVAELCDDLSIPKVTGFDACADVFVNVAMVQDTLNNTCREGLVIRRTWSAVDACNHTTTIEQLIVIGDNTAPEILVPTNSIIRDYVDLPEIPVVLLSQSDILAALDDLQSNSVFVLDNCDEEIAPLFTVDVIVSENVQADGYTEQRTYSWVARDICGNESSVKFTIYILDDMPPVFELPDDITVICAPLPSPSHMLPEEAGEEMSVTFTESIEPGDEAGEFIVTRTWIATDMSGNSSVRVQHIRWIPDSFLACEIITPESVECNTHGVVISSDVTGGFDPFTYFWVIEGDECFIQAGQGTPEITIYVGFSEITITLYVTDLYGCTTTCASILDCNQVAHGFVIGAGSNNPGSQASEIFTSQTFPAIETGDMINNVSVWPNPAQGTFSVDFEFAKSAMVNISVINFMGNTVLDDQMKALAGHNSKKLDISRLPDGAYIVKIESNEHITTRKLIVLSKD